MNFLSIKNSGVAMLRLVDPVRVSLGLGCIDRSWWQSGSRGMDECRDGALDLSCRQLQFCTSSCVRE